VPLNKTSKQSAGSNNNPTNENQTHNPHTHRSSPSTRERGKETDVFPSPTVCRVFSRRKTQSYLNLTSHAPHFPQVVALLLLMFSPPPPQQYLYSLEPINNVHQLKHKSILNLRHTCFHFIHGFLFSQIEIYRTIILPWQMG
jgi:hypothetical protein